ncbi:MAG: putative Ig domain-containing protein [Planctomycetes bacterium]|nr:putative Ig domain-containing protein [Planctomycetota bacterium]
MNTRTFFSRLLVVAVLLGLAVAHSAASSTSTNFRLEAASSPGAAGNAFSTNFRLIGAVPESVAGAVGVSTNYRLNMDLIPDSYLPDDLIPPVITAGPTVVYTGHDRALIEWTTDEIATGVVDYGLTVAYGSQAAQSGGFSTLHQVLVTGLAANTLYNFRVNSTDPYNNGPTQSANATFTTLATPDTTPPGVTPTVTFAGVTVAQIDFTTTEAATSIVRHGPTAALGTNLPDTEYRTSHTRTITGLTAGATHFYAIDATDASGNTSTGTATSFVLPDAVAITTTALPGATQGQAYSQFVAATGGVGALTFTVTSGSLPPGLSLNAATGEIAGSATGTGTFNFDVRAADSGTPTSEATQALSIVVSTPGGGGGGGGGGGSDGGCSTGAGHSWWLAALLALAGLTALARMGRAISAS